MSRSGDTPKAFGLPVAGQAGGDPGKAPAPPAESSHGIDHLAALHGDAGEQVAAVAPFVEHGLRTDRRCVYVAHHNTAGAVRQALEVTGIDVAAAVEAGDLVVTTADEIALHGETFDGDSALAAVTELLSTATADGYAGLHVAAEMTWTLESETPNEVLVAYESALQELSPSLPLSYLCQYDTERFPEDLLEDVVRTHPLVVRDGIVARNDRFVPPAAFEPGEGDDLDVAETLATLFDDAAPEGAGASEGPPGDDGPRPSSESRIVPLIDDRGNWRVIREWIDRHYELCDPDGDREPDCYVVDRSALESNRDRLRRRREDAEPTILPVVLVRNETDPELGEAAQDLVDEVLQTPIRTATFGLRLESVLRYRRLSGDLTDERDQLEQLAEAAAHDLRNPLNLAQVTLEELDLEGDAAEHLRASLERMERLVDDVLAVARTGERVAPDEIEPVDLPSLVDDVWDVLPFDAATVDVTLPADLTVPAKPILLEQLLDNLLRNAGIHGGEDVSVRVEHLPDADGIAIADDGPGIAPEDRERVFEAGYTTAAGNGLGLRVVDRVCAGHGWNVALSESADGGARFEITDMDLRVP